MLCDARKAFLHSPLDAIAGTHQAYVDDISDDFDTDDDTTIASTFALVAVTYPITTDEAHADDDSPPENAKVSTVDVRLSNHGVRAVNDYIQQQFEFSMLGLAEDIALFERVDDKDLLDDFIDAACVALHLVGSRRENVIFRVLDIIQDLRIVPYSTDTEDSEGK